ncbi:hypothetical protein [Enterobacter sp. H2G27]
MGSIKEAYISNGDTTLKDEGWIGMCAMILTSVTIRENAVVAADAVVTKDVPLARWWAKIWRNY